MALYERKAVPFHHDDDSEDDMPSKKMKITTKASVKAQPVKSKPSLDISIDADEEEEPEEDIAESSNRILKELEAKKKITAPTVAAPVIVDVLDDEIVTKAQKLLQKSQSARQQKVSAVDLIDLDSPDPAPTKNSYVPLKIARANERRAINLEEEDNTIEYLRSLTQSSSSNQASSSSSSSKVASTVDDSAKLKLVTRLNGEHEWKWRVPLNDVFGKMKKKFAEIYGVNQDQFKFIFDGSVLKDSETPEDVEMEDSNIIDVKIDKSLYVKAVANATKFAKANESKPQPSSVPVSQSAESTSAVVDDTPKVKLVTRLNGEHEWKWRIPIGETFLKMKKKFAEIYGVNQDQFKFIFDGSVLKDSETPEDVEMEDSNIIDVKMDNSLYAKAIARAAKAK